MNATPNMSTLLFDTYGTNNTAQHSSEDSEKVAAAELFMGLCKEAGIDPSHLSDDQINALWGELQKSAGELPPQFAKGKDDKKPEGDKKDEKSDKDEKKEAAAREWQEKRAAAEKVAEADALGRIMAHAFVDETKKIAAAQKVAELPPQFLNKGKGEDKGEGKPGHEKGETASEEKKEEEKKKESQARAAELLAKLSAQNGASSSTPNLDEQAAGHAIELLRGAGADEKIAQARITAVYTLGLQESTKVASAQTPDAALTVRALEFCEAAGYPVDWSKV